VSPRSHSFVRAGLASSLVVAALLSGCAGDDAENRSSSAELTPEVSAGATEGQAASEAASESDAADAGTTDVPSFPGDTEPDTAEASADARVTVSDIRVGGHDGFDRVVLEVGGEGTPGWDVRYVDQASSQGKGDPVEVAGDAVLQVTLTGAGYPYDTGVEEYSAASPLSAADTDAVTEVVFDATFEGTTVAFVGTTARAPFRVYLLESPTRVVLEVAHAG
jgi:hypothetical protein